MMRNVYVKVVDGVATEVDLHAFMGQHKHVSFPRPLTAEAVAPFGLEPAVELTPPDFDRFEQYLNRSQTATQIDGVWTFTWTVETLEGQRRVDYWNMQKAITREKRNRLLAECDWTQGKDIPDAVSTVWAEYRQALRDLPEQEGFPKTSVWPTKPE